MVESINTQSEAKHLGFFFKGPISSLCFQPFGESLRLLAAEGPSLTVYDLQTKQIVHNAQLFPGCFKITDMSLVSQSHGTSWVCVHTEKSLKVLDSSEGYRVRWEFLKQAVDKIIHAHAMIQHDGCLRLVTVSAHNYVELWDFTESGGATLTKRQFCTEECILYSADYNVETQLVAAGTVFRTVLIWSLQNLESDRSPVLLKLQGHAGVILDVKFLSVDTVASVSDDRSLRVWRLSNLGAPQPSYQQIGEYYGHRSRIWKVRELGWQDMLVSVSEDATCKLWQQNDGVSGGSVETLKGHMGRNIRALACHQGLIATGGEDGAIKVWNAAEIIAKKTQNEELQNSQIQSVQIPYPNQEEKLLKYQVLSIEIVTLDAEKDLHPVCFVGTSKGTLYQIPLQQDKRLAPSLVYQDPKQGVILDIKATTVHLTLDLGLTTITLIAVAVGVGDILILALTRPSTPSATSNYESYIITEVSRFKLSDTKIVNLFLFKQHQHKSPHSFTFDLCASTVNATILKQQLTITRSEADSTLSLLRAQAIFSYQVSIKTQLICAELVTLPDADLLVAGDLKGYLFVFDYKPPSEQLDSQEEAKDALIVKVPAMQQLKGHSKERVLSIKYSNDDRLLYSTSKDKHVNVYRFNKSEVGMSLEGMFLIPQTQAKPEERYYLTKVSQEKEEDLNIIYQLEFHGGSRKCVMLGFYGNNAYIWNKQENMQIMSVDCKGGNRPIKLRLQGQHVQSAISEANFGKSYVLAYSQADMLTIVNNWKAPQCEQENQHYNLRESLHGREILSALALPFPSQDQSQGFILLTGSEDTFLKVSLFTPPKTLRPLSTFCNHVASIRTIVKLRLSDSDYLILSAGSRMQAQVYRASFSSSDGKTAGFKMDHVCQFMRSFEQDEDQDFRIMSASLFKEGDQYYAAFGNSQGLLQVLWINLTKRRLEDVTKHQFSSSILSMKRLSLKTGLNLLMCGLSNGDIVILSIQAGNLKILADIKLAHEFGVNSLDAKKIDEEHFCLSSGGDDQQLAVFLISLMRLGDVVLARHKIYAHSSSIKGVTLMRSSENGFAIGSSSYDQRFKEWALSFTEAGIQLTLKKVTRHCMSDMNGIAHVKTGEGTYQTVLVGQGLAIF